MLGYLGIETVDFAELFCPGRFASAAGAFHLMPGPYYSGRADGMLEGARGAAACRGDRITAMRRFFGTIESEAEERQVARDAAERLESLDLLRGSVQVAVRARTRIST